MIFDFYYRVWVDGIVKLRSRPENKGVWKFYAITFISFAMALNIMLLMVIFQRYVFKSWIWDIDVKVFGSDRLNGFVSFLLLFLLIPLVLNYLLIFRNNRYEILIKKYKSHNGKLTVTYLMISYFLPLVSLVIAYLLGVK